MYVIQQNEWVLKLSLINSKMFYLIKKLIDIKWKEFKVKSITERHMNIFVMFWR